MNPQDVTLDLRKKATSRARGADGSTVPPGRPRRNRLERPLPSSIPNIDEMTASGAATVVCVIDPVSTGAALALPRRPWPSGSAPLLRYVPSGGACTCQGWPRLTGWKPSSTSRADSKLAARIGSSSAWKSSSGARVVSTSMMS